MRDYTDTPPITDTRTKVKHFKQESLDTETHTQMGTHLAHLEKKSGKFPIVILDIFSTFSADFCVFMLTI